MRQMGALRRNAGFDSRPVTASSACSPDCGQVASESFRRGGRRVVVCVAKLGVGALPFDG